MALSQADFYAFSQATGTQVPEDAAGRAQLAPYVLEWRRSQLKQPSQEGEGSNLLQTVGGLAAAAGLGTAAVLGARRLGGRRVANAVSPVTTPPSEQVTRVASQPVPNLRTTPGGQPGPDTARPPIPRQPTQSSVQSFDIPDPLASFFQAQSTSDPVTSIFQAQRIPDPLASFFPSQGIPDPFGKGTVPKSANPGVQTVSTRALPAAEPEYAAYRPDPTDAVSAAVAEARRKAATAGLVETARRAAPYQAEIPGVKATLMALRSPAGALAEETGELIAKAESRPLSAAPAQQTLLGYVREAAEPQGDATDRLVVELNQRRSLVENQQAKQVFNVDQAINALDSGEDQMTGRVRQQLQRNEDLNLSRIDQAEDLTNNIDVAASMTPDGVPVDQAETGALLNQSSAARFLASERDEIASQLGEQGLTITPGRIEAELSRRLGKEAYQYGPKYTQRKQALQLGATYDPALFENMAKPSVRIAGTDFSTGRVPGVEKSFTEYTKTPVFENIELGLRQPTYMTETAEFLQDRVNKQKDFLGQVRLEVMPQINQLQKQQNMLGEQQNMLLASLSKKPDRQLGKQLQVVAKQIEDNNSQLAFLNRRLEGATNKVQENISEFELPSRLRPGVEEGQRIAYQIDPLTNQPLAGTEKIVSERKMVDMTPKGGGGRNVAEFSAGTRDEGIDVDLESILQQQRIPRDQSARDYEKDQFNYRPGTGLTGKALEGTPFTDDRTQTGRTITRTGIQLDAPQAGTMKGAVNPYSQLDNETLGMISLMGGEADAANASRMLARRQREGYDPGSITGPGLSNRVVVSQKPTEAGRLSIDASEKMRRAYIDERPEKAQSLLKQKMAELGISAVGEFSPYPRR